MSEAALPVGTVASGSDLVNILLVDDEPRNLVVLETLLDEPGYRLVRANSGDEALLALTSGDFAVLVLDVRMPGMTGFELARMIKDRKRTALIPIIFLTAYYNEDQHVIAGYGTGAVDYLHKPVNPTVLRAKVAVFAEMHRKSRALEAANRLLHAEVAERRRAEERLEDLAQTLDRRVIERTAALQASEARLRDVNQRKDEFLATLAHELRNPLAPVRNAVVVLRRTGLAADTLAWAVDLIDRQVRSMVRLVDDLMDASRVSQGKIELRPEATTLEAVLHEAMEATRPLIEECGHRLRLALPREPLPLHADRLRLSQAFTNLLNNAAKYMDRGGRIDLSAVVEGDEVVVRCKDGGIGIDAAHLGEVFGMFSQVESALSRSRGGLGIGLSLTRHLVQLHGGSIVARSAGLGEGTEFEVRLPLSRSAPPPPAPGIGAAPPPAPGIGAAPPPAPGIGAAPAARPAAGLRILVADDTADAAESTAMLLLAAGNAVRRVGDGQAAVAAVGDFDPQLVLLDLGMPLLNGYESCRRIRAQDGGAQRTLVAVSGWGQPEDLRKSREAGFDRHFVKPVEPAVLLDLVATLVAGRGAEGTQRGSGEAAGAPG
ncbi:MAG: response regulator [Rubrivivax sp.]|nr:response regulator [Rubrivivax sp.]